MKQYLNIAAILLCAVLGGLVATPFANAVLPSGNGQTTKAKSVSVTIASDQTVPVSGTITATVDTSLIATSAKQDPTNATIAAQDATLAASAQAIGGVGKTAEPSAVTTGNQVRAWFDLKGRQHTFSDPAYDFAAVTPSDGSDLGTKPTRGLYVGVGGDVVLDSANGTTTIKFASVPSGTTLPVAANRVRSTNTTATNIVALY